MENTQAILPLDSPDATLAAVGGKALNLARLARAGFPVPGGFFVGTEAYRAFVAANGVQAGIVAVLDGLAPDDPEALQAASAEIRGRFAAGTLPTDLADALTAAYLDLGSPPVAVRSSATAEDLPDMSFAGQQDTFLNVVGAEALLRAVVECWSSLWTARAIGYRARNEISHEEAALAVVVQEMVQSEASGVLFTANPLSGTRTETVIDATLGLGEALVAGLVEPDHYVVDSENGRVLAKTVGQKSLVIASRPGGGTHSTEGRAQRAWSIPDEVVLELVELGRRVAEHYDGEPQDIEWAWADGRLFLLQSRPITSLFPLPPDLPDPCAALASFGAFQGVLDPMTPFGRDMLIHFLAAIAAAVGQHLDPRDQQLIFTAGERLFVNIGGALRHKRARRLIRGVLSAVEPGIGQAVEGLLDDPRFAPQPRRPSLRTIFGLLRFALPVFGRIVTSMMRPDASRRQTQALIEDAIVRFRAEGAATQSLSDLLMFIDAVYADIVGQVLPRLLPRLIAALAPLNLLLKLARQTPEGEGLALKITRGLPHNVTTEMDLALWRTAEAIRSDAESMALFEQAQAAELAARFQAENLPPTAELALTQFLDRYGVRGLAEIDIGRPRWRENPTPVMQAVQSYVQITDPQLAPDAVSGRGAEAGEAAVERLAQALGGVEHGRMKARLARALAKRVRALAGLRETPKWTIINFMGVIRERLLVEGEKLAGRGVIPAADDVFFLNVEELRALAAGRQQDWPGIIRARRQAFAQEMRRRQAPRLMLGDGTAFYEGVASGADDADGVITGSPVSPGMVEGRVRVVLDPHHAGLQAGEIMVCPGTDPSWTPLFLAAGGLVMEVGGMMTHGSVVAREYGIPAVVGVSLATERLETGQWVRVNGSSGEITLVEAKT